MLLRDGKSLDGRVADDWRDENRQVSLMVARAGSWAADAARCRWRWFWAARAGRHGVPQRALLLRGATWRAERVRRGLRLNDAGSCRWWLDADVCAFASASGHGAWELWDDSLSRRLTESFVKWAVAARSA